MRINDIFAVNQDTIPRTIVRCRSYRNLVSQVFLGPCTSTAQIDNRIIEEECEEDEMVEDGPSDDLKESPTQQLLVSERANGNNWQSEQNEDSSDKEDDDEVEEANIPGQFNNSQIQNNIPINSHLSVPPEIKVTVDDSLLQMAHEYRENFDGFAEINRFNTIEEMHDFIKSTLESSPTLPEIASDKQERYLDILLNEKPENRFGQLFDTSQLTVRHVLSRNDVILRELFASASLDNFPSPLAELDDSDVNEEIDDEIIYENSRDVEVEENMKRWYMIEMIGLWLKLITDVTSYREAIKRRVLKKSWGIENDRYEGIAVPLKYK